MSAIQEDFSDFIKASTALTPPAATLMGYTLEDWAFIVSIVAGALLIIERLPRVYALIKEKYEKHRK